MKRKLIFLIVLAIALTSVPGFVAPEVKKVEAAPAFQKVNFTDAVVTASALNVRQGPSTSYKIVCTLKKGQKVKIFGKIGNWYAIYEPATGCVGAVDSKYLKAAGSTPAQQTPAKTPSKKTQTPTTQTPQLRSPHLKLRLRLQRHLLPHLKECRRMNRKCLNS